MIILTGGAGFIGSCILWKLNEEGVDDIIVVDKLDKSDRDRNLENKKYKDYLDKDEFIRLVSGNKLGWDIDCIIHMGACTSTTSDDKDYMMSNNFEYSLRLAKWAIEKRVFFIYASSAATYGDGSLGFSDSDQVTKRLRPLNIYAYSKHLFDLWVINNKLSDKVVGLKFFNVFGPNEYHKQDMRSVACKKFDEIKQTGKVRLFKSYKKEYKDGQQKRDFIYVKDAVSVVNFFFENRTRCGIYNVGTGKAHSWNELAMAMFKHFKTLVNIEYFDMPENLRLKYQYFTKAIIGKLQDAGYKKEFWTL